MKLRARFLQLPVMFDHLRLAEEVASIPASEWRAHPKNFPGNDALPLITTDGDPSSDARAGAMGPTPSLLACPYLMQVLETLGATWGRSRLMRLSGDAEVTAHVDTDYYWRDHMRVHIPIVTQPTVRFHCGDEVVNMAAGECWIFDTWSLHRVHNDATRARIHLVADTVGGDGLLNLIERGRSPGSNAPDWTPSAAPPRSAPASLAYETKNVPDVMTPWEMRDHLGFLLGEVAPGHPSLGAVAQTLNRLRVNWHALWARSGDLPSVRPEYAALLLNTWRTLEAQGVHSIPLKNQMALGLCLKALIFDAALSGGGGSSMDGDDRMAPPSHPASPSARPNAPVGAAPAGLSPTGQFPSAPALTRDPHFDRPIFIVSPPRSGSTLLFETLAKSEQLSTIGGESHGLIEAISQLHPSSQGWASNRLTAADATPAVIQQIRQRFFSALRDAGGRPATPGRPVRMLEKTPKNALRIPFLAKAFPEAQFVYLYRNPRPTLASMIEAWSSGRFKTYGDIPGWSGLPWSLLLIPGWQELVGAKLPEIAATQWATATRFILDDLSVLPPQRWRSIQYEDLIGAPGGEVRRLCRGLEIAWTTPLGATLPIARNALTPPDPGKWRKHEGEIDRVWPLISAQDERARAVFEAQMLTRAPSGDR